MYVDNHVQDQNNGINIMVVAGAVVAIIAGIVYDNMQQFNQTVYVRNVYLYVILAILLTALMDLLMQYYGVVPSENYTMVALVGALFILCAFSMTSNKNVILRHVFYGLFIMAFGFMLYPEFLLFEQQGICRL